MHQSEEKKQLKLEDYWAIVRRRRWWLIAPLFLGWAMVIGATWSIPAMYRSETLIIVEQQKVPEHYVVPNVAADLQQRLQSMTQQILSRTRLQGIIQTFHLYTGEQGVADRRHYFGSHPASARRRGTAAHRIHPRQVACPHLRFPNHFRSKTRPR